MSHYIDPRQRAFEETLYGVVRTIDANGRITAQVLAKRELLENQMAANAVRRQLGPTSQGPGSVRRWLGSRLVAFGTRLAGVQAGLQGGAPVIDETAATHATP